MLSIVIPAYNEEKRLTPFINDVLTYINKLKKEIEIIIVDDGSNDNTNQIAQEFASTDKRIRIITSQENCGKGSAVKKGILNAKGSYILFIDADGATSITELDKVFPLIENKNDIIIGSRNIKGSLVKRNIWRRFLAFVFNLTVNAFAVSNIKDTQCGFKILQKDIAIELFTKMKENRWAFDVELLYLAQFSGYSITEIPVNWDTKEGSKLQPIKDGIKMFFAIFRIKRNHS